MRAFTNTLIFENIFDSVPTNDIDMADLYRSVVNPNVSIIEEDCGTTSGRLKEITYNLSGEVELATNTPLSGGRIELLLSQGIYKIAVAGISTCVSTGGVCRRCHSASFPDQTTPPVGSKVIIYPEEVLNVDILKGNPGDTSFPLSTDYTSFKKVRVYLDGIQTSGFTISSTTLTLTTPLVSFTNIIIKYIDDYYLVFLKYLARSYSGSIVGMRALTDNSVMPIKTSLLSSLISKSKLELIRNKIKAMSSIPIEYRDYLSPENVPDSVEESLLIIALYNIYGNL